MTTQTENSWPSVGDGRPVSAPLARRVSAEVLIERDAAKARARELLLSFLNEEQRIEFEAHKHFTVIGKDKIYRVNYGVIANIEVLDRHHQRRHRLCVHPEGERLPVEDVMLSQLLHLRADEAALTGRANVHP